MRQYVLNCTKNTANIVQVFYVGKCEVSEKTKFGDWELDLQTGEISKSDLVICLPKQQHQLLALLINAGAANLVPREDIIQTLWPAGRVVEYDQSLNTCIRKLRKSLGDDSAQPKYIETVPGRGYRLIAHTQLKNGKRISLRRIGVGLGFVAIALLVWTQWSNQVAEETVPVLAVLPISHSQNSSSDPLATTLREELLTQFSRAPIQQLTILAPDSLSKFQDKPPTSGTLTLNGNIADDPVSTRIHMRLSDGKDKQLWAKSFNWLKGAGLPSHQRIAHDVIQAVSETLDIKIPQNTVPTIALTEPAMSHFNQGIFLAQQQRQNAKPDAIAKFKQVLELHPNYVPALAKLASLYIKLASTHPLQRASYFEQALLFADRALDLDQKNTEALVAKAYYQLYHARAFSGSRFSLDKAIALAPNSSEARSLSAAWYASQNMMNQAIDAARLAKRIDPLSMTVNADLCWYLNFANLFQQAIEECNTILQLDPNAVWTRLGLVEAYIQQQNWSDAYVHLISVLNIPSQELTVTKQQAVRGIYQRWAEKMLKGYQQGSVDAYMIASLHARFSAPEITLSWLQKALTENNGFIVFIVVDPRFSAIRQHPTFKALLAEIYLKT